MQDLCPVQKNMLLSLLLYKYCCYCLCMVGLASRTISHPDFHSRIKSGPGGYTDIHVKEKIRTENARLCSWTTEPPEDAGECRAEGWCQNPLEGSVFRDQRFDRPCHAQRQRFADEMLDYQQPRCRRSPYSPPSGECPVLP